MTLKNLYAESALITNKKRGVVAAFFISLYNRPIHDPKCLV
jgi:hypothetical protein